MQTYFFLYIFIANILLNINKQSCCDILEKRKKKSNFNVIFYMNLDENVFFRQPYIYLRKMPVHIYIKKKRRIFHLVSNNTFFILVCLNVAKIIPLVSRRSDHF